MARMARMARMAPMARMARWLADYPDPKRDTVRVKCLAQRLQQSARSRASSRSLKSYVTVRVF